MLPRVLSIIFVIVFTEAAKVPPKYEGSYSAQGEIVEEMKYYGDRIMQLFFEENYDQEKKRSNFMVWEDKQSVSIVENLVTDQTFQYYQNVCTLYTYKDWVESNTLDIKPFETPGAGTVVFPLKQLLKLNSTTLRENEEQNTTFRDIPAVLWKHRITYQLQNVSVSLDVDSYWSRSYWPTASANSTVPLGFILVRTEKDKYTDAIQTFNQAINIFYFASNTVDQNAFKIRQGIPCVGLKETIPFPNVMEKITVFAFSLEFIFTGFDSLSTVDVWWDIKNTLLRIDFDPLNRNPNDGPQYTSEITSLKQGTIYTLTDSTCQVTTLDERLFDPQRIIDPSNTAMWNIGNFFGLDETSLIYIGDTEKRGIPCSVWQGERIDWPKFDRPTTTIWEWCIAKKNVIDFEKTGFPLVNLEITVKEIPDKPKSFLKKGMKFVYNFYNVKHYSPAYLDSVAFDISSCFPNNNLKLQFLVDIDRSIGNLLKNTTNDPAFLSLWKSSIIHKIGLNFTSLRIAKLRTFIEGEKMVVIFTLLGVHPNLTKEVKAKEIGLPEAKEYLQNAVNKKDLSIEWMAKDKKRTLTAIPDSLTEQYSITTTTKPDTTTTTDKESSIKTSDGGRLTRSITERSSKPVTDQKSTESSKHTDSTYISDGGDTTVKTTTKKSITEKPSSLTQKEEYIGHSPSIMALVSILMLFTGSGIGATSTYLSFKWERLL